MGNENPLPADFDHEMGTDFEIARNWHRSSADREETMFLLISIPPFCTFLINQKGQLLSHPLYFSLSALCELCC